MRRSVLLVLLTMLVIGVRAQSNNTKERWKSDSVFIDKKNYNPTEQKDLREVIRGFFKRHHSSSHQIAQSDSGFQIQPFSHPVIQDSLPIKPGKLLFAPFPAIGYALQTGTTAIVSMNLSFYTGNSDSTNLSSIAINPTRSLNHNQSLLPVIFDIWSKKNKLDFIGDWRYYKYPTYTYGLGGHTQLTNADLINYSYIRIYQEALKHIVSDFYGGMGYNFDYHFDIKEEGSGSDFHKYNGNATKTVSSGLSLNLIYDTRKNTNYPISAFYGNFIYRSNFTFLGSNQNWQSMLLEFKKYIKVSPHSNNVLAFWNLSWFTFGGKPPYFDLPSTGWDSYSNTGRGYIQGRLRGPSMLYLETEYRFGITRNGLFGGVVFGNIQTISEWGNNRFETALPGTGLGIRIKINKLSGANLAIDYGFGMGGSQGLFFNVSEVF